MCEEEERVMPDLCSAIRDWNPSHLMGCMSRWTVSGCHQQGEGSLLTLLTWHLSTSPPLMNCWWRPNGLPPWITPSVFLFSCEGEKHGISLSLGGSCQWPRPYIELLPNKIGDVMLVDKRGLGGGWEARAMAHPACRHWFPDSSFLSGDKNTHSHSPSLPHTAISASTALNTQPCFSFTELQANCRLLWIVYLIFRVYKKHPGSDSSCCDVWVWEWWRGW